MTYDVVFNNSTDSNNAGFKQTIEYCLKYIARYNGSNISHFADYKGAHVQVVCNETGIVEFETKVL